MLIAVCVVAPTLAVSPIAQVSLAALSLLAIASITRKLLARRHAALLLVVLLLASAPAVAQVIAPQTAILSTCSEDVIANTCGPGPSWCREWHEWACWLCSLGLC